MAEFKAGQHVFTMPVDLRGANLTPEMREWLRRPAMLGVVIGVNFIEDDQIAGGRRITEYLVKVTSPPSAAGRDFYFLEGELRIPTEDDFKIATLEVVTDVTI